MIAAIKRVYLLIVAWFRSAELRTIEPTTASSAPLPEPAQLEIPSSEVVQQHNRATRRAMERARRRRDKFVTPKGPTPISKPRQTARVARAVKKPTRDEPEPKIDDDMLYAESEVYGEFNFRDTILNQLDRYWVYLERMKKSDPDAYGFYKQIGATITPYITLGTHKPSSPDTGPFKPEELEAYKKEIILPSWFKQHRPSFGCMVYGANPEAEKRELEPQINYPKSNLWIPKFMYFTKYSSPPPELQPMSGGDVYKMTIWWDQPHDTKFAKRKPTPTEFGVFISADGNHIQVLRMIETRMVSIKKKGSLGHFSIPQRSWRIPGDFENWAKDFGLDAQTHLAHLFCQAIKAQEHSNYSIVRVAVHKRDLTAVFGVNVKRMSYFFQDRDIELTDGGVKKRIFHMVRTHERQTKKGKQYVKFHFRGLREFEWAGYRVSITVPGRDHFMLSEVNFGAIDGYWMEKGEQYLMAPEIGELVVKKMKEGLLATRQRPRLTEEE
jgi:hypothetical protein